MGLFSKKKKVVEDVLVLSFDIEKVKSVVGGNFGRHLYNILLKVPLKDWCPGSSTMFFSGETLANGNRVWCIAASSSSDAFLTASVSMLRCITSSGIAPTYIGEFMTNIDIVASMLTWDFDIQRDIASWKGNNPVFVYHAIDREGHGNEGHDDGLGYRSFRDVFGKDLVQQ